MLWLKIFILLTMFRSKFLILYYLRYITESIINLNIFTELIFFSNGQFVS